jgi:UDP-apiose/xylose synthase
VKRRTDHRESIDVVSAPASTPSTASVRHAVVIGCGGFLGSHLLDRLLAVPAISVDGWDCSSAKIRPHLDNPRFRFHLGSAADTAAMAVFSHAVRAADVVINLAAVCNPSEYNTRPAYVIRSNFSDLTPILDICVAEKTWLVHFSTSEVYGRTLASYVTPGKYEDTSLYELDEETSPLVMGPISSQRWTYACAKQLLERLIVALHHEAGLSYTIVRPLNVFGPRMDYIPGRDGSGLPRVLASFMGALLDGTPLQVVDGGQARRTIVSVNDAVDAIMLILARRADAERQIFNIGNPANEVTILELADLMRRTYARITGDESYRYHPIALVSAADLYGEGYEDCDRRLPRIDKARELLGWEPRQPLADILLETMASFRLQYSRPTAGPSWESRAAAAGPTR